eukprot:512612_1
MVYCNIVTSNVSFYVVALILIFITLILMVYCNTTLQTIFLSSILLLEQLVGTLFTEKQIQLIRTIITLLYDLFLIIIQLILTITIIKNSLYITLNTLFYIINII